MRSSMNVAIMHDMIGRTVSVGVVSERLDEEIVEDASSSKACLAIISLFLVDEKVGKRWGVDVAASQTSTPFAWSSGDRRTEHPVCRFKKVGCRPLCERRRLRCSTSFGVQTSRRITIHTFIRTHRRTNCKKRYKYNGDIRLAAYKVLEIEVWFHDASTFYASRAWSHCASSNACISAQTSSPLFWPPHHIQLLLECR